MIALYDQIRIEHDRIPYDWIQHDTFQYDRVRKMIDVVLGP